MLDDGQAARHAVGDGDQIGRLVGQRVQELDQVAGLLVGQREARQLLVDGHAILRAAAFGVEIDHFFERVERAIVHVGRAQRDVAQARHLEGAHAVRRVDRLRLTEIGVFRVGVRHAEDVEGVVGEGRQRVALEAAGLRAAEYVEAAPLGGRQGVEIPGDVAVERRVLADQRALEGSNRAGDVLDGDAIAERLGKHCFVFGDGSELLNHLIHVRAHLVLGGQRHEHLIFQRLGAPVPEQTGGVGDVPQRRRIAAQILAVRPLRDLASVAEAEVRVMAGRTRQIVVSRQHRIVEQQPPQRRLIRIDGRQIGKRRLQAVDRLIGLARAAALLRQRNNRVFGGGQEGERRSQRARQQQGKREQVAPDRAFSRWTRRHFPVPERQ